MNVRRYALGPASVLLASWPALLFAQSPAGPEFRVNTYTTSQQRYPSVAGNASGDFVVMWSSYNQDGNSLGIFGQRFDPAGIPRGAEFRANTYTTREQYFPSVAMDATGDFVVSWMSYTQDGSSWGVFGQRFGASGAPQGTEFRVNTYTTSAQAYPSVAADAAGNFVVVWNSYGQDGAAYGIFAQRFDAAGTPRGAEFRVNTFTTSVQRLPVVAADVAGNFVVAWQSYGEDGSSWGIFGQRFDGSGVPQGSEFRVNTFTAFGQAGPSVALDTAGRFVVAWHSFQDGSNYGIFAQRFDAAGTPQGAEFQVNTFTVNQQRFPSVAISGAGQFVVAWQSFGPDGNGYGISVQRFDAFGTPMGGEFRANTYTPIAQVLPVTVADAVGNFVVIWDSYGQDGSGRGVFGQRFGGLRPSALAVDPAPTSGSDGNGVFEPGEQVFVSPSWRNVAGAARSFQGDGLGFSGPVGSGGPFYGLIDDHADYGTVADGSTASCGASTGDCYVLAISVPSSRPVQHMDATFQEAILPEALGQTKRWTIHVGGSFTDVPTSSGFYRFVETLLHYSITGGCGGTSYCPSSSTSREQMAVFVLVAKEGAGFVPPACTTPVFNDVPASSPFCKWIEELARRGVVAGCGGGNYCPGDAVTREQMAVFVLRTLDPALNPPACTTPMFADVPASSPFCKWIEELARRGVVVGCGGGNYCPTQPVTREQMGVFISRTFGLSLYGP